jgi:Phosphodiester glycosidase
MSRAAALLPLALAACHDSASPRSAYESLDDLAATPTVLEAALPAPAPVPPSPCAKPPVLGEGLVAERHPLGATPALDLEPCFDVVRADATRFHMTLLTKAHEGSSQPAPAWRERYRLTAVTNAGMFHATSKPVGMVIDDGTKLSKNHPQYGGYIAFDPRSADDAPLVITGRDCAGFDLAALEKQYKSVLQSNRLLGCNGEALTWKDPKQYSAAAFGVDRKGNPVFIHSRAAVTMTELAVAISKLDLAGALFLEGGPEASLVVRGSEGELQRVGSYEQGFVQNDENRSFWWLPNVLALEAN